MCGAAEAYREVCAQACGVKTLTSLNKEVRPFFLATVAFGVFALFLPLAITAFGAPEGYFNLAIIAFGAFQFIVASITENLLIPILL